MQPNQFTNARKSVACYVGCVKKLNELCFNFFFYSFKLNSERNDSTNMFM